MKTAGLFPVKIATSQPGNGDHLAAVYRYAARIGAIEALDVVATELGIAMREMNEAVAQLVESRLLRAEDAGRRFVPVDPQIAAAMLVSSVEREIYQRRELIDLIRDRIDAFQPEYADSVHGANGSVDGGANRSPNGTNGSNGTVNGNVNGNVNGRVNGHAAPYAPASVDYLAESMEVRGLLKVAGDACREEVLVLQSSMDDADEFEDASRVYLPLLARGIQIRVICQHRSRADFSARMRMKKWTEAGASVRTVSHVPRAAAVFDRSLAVIFGLPGEVGVARVHNRGVVQFLLDLFNHLWDAATPLEGAETGYANVADDLQQAIAGLMAKGYTDEVVARKLGMSVRTCRRHIAAMMRDLDAISRFQAGVQAARRSLVNGS
jgi:DNA-binding CsgD family transcriptional regulator